MKNDKLTLYVRAREGVVYQGEVNSITSKNEKGVFDVLGMHANFVTLLNDVLTVNPVNGEEFKLNIPNGILRVLQNKVEVYVGVK